MHNYSSHDFLTPNLLLKESVAYARLLLHDLQQAPIASHRANPHMMTVGVQCTSINNAYYRNKGLTQDLLVLRRSYEATHPAIVNGFERLLHRLMSRADFTEMTPPTVGIVPDLQDNAYTLETTRSLTDIVSLRVKFVASPEKLRAALDVQGHELERLCLQSLQETFAEMGARNKQASLRRHAIPAPARPRAPGF